MRFDDFPHLHKIFQWLPGDLGEKIEIWPLSTVPGASPLWGPFPNLQSHGVALGVPKCTVPPPAAVPFCALTDNTATLYSLAFSEPCTGSGRRECWRVLLTERWA